MVERQKKVAAYGFGLLLLATILAGVVELARRPRTQLTRVTIGSKDEIYYSHAATKEDARALGQALRGTGFLNDRGTTVFLSKGTAGTVVSFVLSEGGWNHPDTVYSFEEIGRRIAASVGGFPVKVRLVDYKRLLHKELAVGKVLIGTRDAVYYFGTATEADAGSVGAALQTAGFFQDRGAVVVFSKDEGKAISFVVNEGVWAHSATVAGFEGLVRAVAPSVAGLPIQLRLLDEAMEPRKSVVVE